MVTTDDEDLAAIEITCHTSAGVIRITAAEDTGERHTFEVEETDLTKHMVQQILAPRLEIALLSGITNTDAYKQPLFSALVGISKCQ